MEARTREHLPEVTDRQLEVAGLIARGFDNPAIAQELGISLAGAKYHVSELLARLNLSSREEVARWYRACDGRGLLSRLGLVPTGLALGAIGGLAAAGIAIAAISLGGGAAEESAATPVVAATAAAQSATMGAFLEAGSPVLDLRLGFTTAALNDGRALLVGGVTRDNSHATEIFDPATGEFALAADTIDGRHSPEAVTLSDGRVLVIGGLTLGDPIILASTEAYDPEANAFVRTASMAEPRWEFAAITLADGRVLVVGGVIENVDGRAPIITDRAELYDPMDDEWTSTGSMHSARRSAHLALLGDGRVLVAGGGPLEVYDPATGEFQLFGGEPIVEDEGAVVTRLADGRVLLTGAYDDPAARRNGDSNKATAAYVIDASSRAIDRVGDLNSGRSQYHTATLLPDGRVLIAGGAGGYGSATIYPPDEVFDPVSNTFERVAFTEAAQIPGGMRATNVSTHIVGHTMTPLADGSVLVIGEVRGGADLTLAAERFIPSATSNDDRYAAVLEQFTVNPPTSGAVIDELGTLTVGPGGEPFEIGSLVASAEAQGLHLRSLPTGIGVCGTGAIGYGAAGIRAEWIDGTPGAEDFAVYIYESPEVLATHWQVDEYGRVTPQSEGECADPSMGGYFISLGAVAMANGNQLLVLDFPHGLVGFDEHDPAVRAALIEAFESMEPMQP